MKSKLIYILLFLLSKFPLRILYSLVYLIYFLNKWIIKYRLKLVHHNINIAFPQLNKKLQFKLINKFYISFFSTIIELIKSISLTENDIIDKVQITNLNLIKKSIKNQKPIVLICSHYSNWEWLLLRIGLIKNINLSAVYKPLSNEYFNAVLFQIRTKFGVKLIPINKWKYFILKHRTTPSTFMFVSDQVPSQMKNGMRVNFFNQSTLFHKGAEKTARLLNADVFYCEILNIKKGYYNIDLKKISLSIDITKEYAKLLEETINKKPENWLWSHDRWKR